MIECEDVSRLSFTKNGINLSEARAEATEKDSAKLSEERLRLFEHEDALNFDYIFSEHILCTDNGNRVEGSIVQLSLLMNGLQQWSAWKNGEGEEATDKTCTKTHTHLRRMRLSDS